MRRYTSRILLLIFLHLHLTLCAAATQCYFPNGKPSGDVPCNASAPVSHCCGSLSHCLSNGLCNLDSKAQSGAGFLRAQCTDKTWQSELCPSQCRLNQDHAKPKAYDFAAKGVLILQCRAVGMGYANPGDYCCESIGEGKRCCNTESATFHLEAATIGAFNGPASASVSASASASSSASSSVSTLASASQSASASISTSTSASASRSTSSPVSLTPTPEPQTTSQAAPAAPRAGLSTGVMVSAGIGAGVGVCVLIGIAIALWWLRKSQKERHAKLAEKNANTGIPGESAQKDELGYSTLSVVTPLELDAEKPAWELSGLGLAQELDGKRKVGY
ncbi:hypothetical protein BDV95DRAFT_605884 [Massariosphaeria phaeospora]|uniref:Mid2 domain-containing protein n=1 Tax=Massariosphaeria phaeospora TaxID=100035 RepID=A0A7C8IAF1_9PLEO|nr:hypothetical protein BDV95DRAFT_605884 [Massariosphaeria phaeospora]